MAFVARYEMTITERIQQSVVRGIVRRLNNRRIRSAARQIALHAPEPSGQPVAFFKASTGIDDLSWNSAFHLLASWALRLEGVPVAYFACHAGMSRCVLGTNRDRIEQAPPCRACTSQSHDLYAAVPDRPGSSSATQVHWFAFRRDQELATALAGLSLGELMVFEWDAGPGETAADVASGTAIGRIPLGSLCLPSLRWILRRQNLADDDNTRLLLREYILSALNVATEFAAFLDAVSPRAVVVFNGQFFPEAVARFVAQRRGIRVITHEVGLQPASAFFTAGEATAYPIHIPDDFELDNKQNSRLDEYLEQRFQGKFSMAGIDFWPNMRGLDEGFLAKAAKFRQIVPIFTNVIFDTSQPHANTVFADMFAWLDIILSEMREHPETLFVIRAHPDETRLRKESRETVEEWVRRSGAADLANVAFVPPREYLSSYELIQQAKFVMVYNSTVGLEASILNVPVLCAGKARFTQYPTVFFPQTQREHLAMMRDFLTAETIEVPAIFKRNARRFLYYQLFRTSLPFGEFLQPSVRKTQSRLKEFEHHNLLNSPAIRAITAGLRANGDFLLRESDD